MFRSYFDSIRDHQQFHMRLSVNKHVINKSYHRRLFSYLSMKICLVFYLIYIQLDIEHGIFSCTFDYHSLQALISSIYANKILISDWSKVATTRYATAHLIKNEQSSYSTLGINSWNSGIVLEVINGIQGIRWNWFCNVQHRGIGCILSKMK